MPPSSKNLENSVVEAAGNLAESFSLNRVAGQLYALLYISPEPVSLEEMAQKLRISKGSASIHIRILEEWEAVRKVWVQGSRKDFYTAEPDFVKVALDRIEKGVARRIGSLNGVLESLKQQAESGGKGTADVDPLHAAFYQERIERVVKAKETVEKALSLFPKLKSKNYVSLLMELVKS